MLCHCFTSSLAVYSLLLCSESHRFDVGVRLADRRGLERGIILLGVAGVSFFISWAFLASPVFTLASNPPLPPLHIPRAKSRSLRTVLRPEGAWQRLRAPAIRLIDVNL